MNAMTIVELKDFAGSFPEVTCEPHFHKISFRVRKKIFATLSEQSEDMVVKLSPVDQSVFCDLFPAQMEPVSGGWGKKGWTSVQYYSMKADPLKDVITTAYKTVAPASLVNLLEG